MKQIDLNPVHETFPLLRFACDEAGERNYRSRHHWYEFLNFRDQTIGVQERLSPLRYASANELWYQFLDEFQGDYGFVALHQDGSPVRSAELFIDPMDKFSSVLENWRGEWLREIAEFVPPQYYEKFTEDDGGVSFTSNPWELLYYSKPRPNDQDLDRYRRWLARRDWFLTNLAMLLRVYRNRFNTASISQWFDDHLIVKDGFQRSSSLDGLLARQLYWEGRDIPVYCNWNWKSVGALLFKVLRKQYSGGKTIYENIFDVYRGRFIVGNQGDFQSVVHFITEFFPQMSLCDDKTNLFSAEKWRAVYFKGWIYGIKFELQVQLFDDYVDANYGHGEVNHGYYKAKQFFNLIPIMLPPEMLERFFKINWSEFCKEYIGFNKKRFEIEE
jgi:hypothetical protein